ncbi:MAG TPA: hypothetical protein VFC06_03345 [Demequina sp.]|nr:hypothetical protein [Cellulomonas sp.]HZL80967.1 hypothetical protein [Demequina sp.]
MTCTREHSSATKHTHLAPATTVGAGRTSAAAAPARCGAAAADEGSEVGDAGGVADVSA